MDEGLMKGVCVPPAIFLSRLARACAVAILCAAGSAQRNPVDSEATIFWGLLFGVIGFAFFVYGKKQQRGFPLACGVGLMVFPYFVSNTILLIAIGVVLSALPYFFRQ
jgi:uncharacterized membrane protein